MMVKRLFVAPVIVTTKATPIGQSACDAMVPKGISLVLSISTLLLPHRHKAADLAWVP